LGQIDVAVEEDQLHDQLDLLVDVEVVGQFHTVVGKGSAVLAHQNST
jgi:hypothetical protein